MMIVKINSERWIAGFKDAYAGIASQARADDDHPYASGRVEGEALRLKHRQEYERLLFGGRQVRPIPQEDDL